MTRRKRKAPKRPNISVSAATYARIRAASPQKRGRAQTQALVEAALNADPVFAAYEVPRG